MTTAEEVKSKLDLVEVVGEYLRLQPAGGQSLKGLCPFHGEKTPSFYAHRDKQFWHCFGCGEGGDLFTFYQKIERLDFPDALRELAARAGVQLPAYDPKIDSERTAIMAVLEDATRFFEAALKQEFGARARSYLQKRGVKPETLSEFRVGYAPATWDVMVKALMSKGHAADKIVAAGLAIVSDKGRGHYDRFRDRIMIPLVDEKGAVVGFTGRILPDSPEAEKTGKYVNTPETLVYRKRRMVFALDKAKGAIKAADFAVLVEGNMDAISSHEAGVRNTVAVSGTAFTEEQIDILKRYCSRIAMAFDADVAGQNAMTRALPHAWKCGLKVMIVLLPAGFKDPDEVIRKDPELWKRAVADAKDMVEYAVERSLAAVDQSDPYSKRKALAALKPLFALLTAEPVLHDHWVHALAERLHVSDEAVRESLGGAAPAPKNEVRSKAAPTAAPVIETREEQLAKRLFALIFSDPGLFAQSVPLLDPAWISEGPLRRLANSAKAYYTEVGQAPLREDGFFAWYSNLRATDPSLPAPEPILFLRERDFAEWTENQIADEVRVCLMELEKAQIKRLQKELLGALAEAEHRADRATATHIAKRLEELAQRSH